MSVQKPYFLGISGGSGSGKTTLLRSLIERFGADAMTLISQDNYYISQSDLPRTLDGQINFDHPNALDLDAFARDMAKLQAGEAYEILEYTFNNPDLVPKMLRFEPRPIVLIEGLFVFNHPDVAQMLDLKIFVDTSEHLRLSRRIKRDAAERGYGLDEVLGYYERFVVPMYREHIAPYRNTCDIIISNDHHMDHSTTVLIDHLEAVLRRKGH